MRNMRTLSPVNGPKEMCQCRAMPRHDRRPLTGAKKNDLPSLERRRSGLTLALLRSPILLCVSYLALCLAPKSGPKRRSLWRRVCVSDQVRRGRTRGRGDLGCRSERLHRVQGIRCISTCVLSSVGTRWVHSVSIIAASKVQQNEDRTT